jgi:hypothetical protein
MPTSFSLQPHPGQHRALVEWMDAHSDSLFLSVVTVAEIEDGIAKLRREGAPRESADLAAWLETVLSKGRLRCPGVRAIVFS